MKVYEKLVLKIDSGEVIEEQSFEYRGEIALCGGSKPKAEAKEGAAGRIVAHLYTPDGKTPGPLQGSLNNILSNPGDDPFTQRQMDLLTQRVRGGFGARGLATSGIAQAGEQQALSDFLMQRGEQKQGQAIQILGTGGSSPSIAPPSQPRGMFGLK